MLDITDIGQASRTLYWSLLGGMSFAALFGVAALRVRAISPAVRGALIANAAIVALLLLFFAGLFLQRIVLQERLLSGDESSTRYQAQLFAAGELWHEPVSPELRPLFLRHHVVVHKDREFSKYPPGTALFGALFILLERPGAMNLAVTALSLLLLLWLARLLSGGWIVPLLAAVPFLFSTTTLFHAASWFSHPAAMLFLLATLIALIRAERAVAAPRRRAGYLLTGLLLGALLLTRPFDAALTALAIACYHLWDLVASRDRRALLRHWLARRWEWFALVAGGTVGAALFLGYQKLYTGSWLLSPYRLYDRSGEVLAELDLSGGHLVGRGLTELTPRFLQQQWEWSSGVVMLLAALYVLLRFLSSARPLPRSATAAHSPWRRHIGTSLKRSERLVILLPLLFILGYALHPFSGGDGYGARYYYPVFWCWCYAAAALVHYLARRFRQGRGAFLYLLFLIAVTVPFGDRLDDACRTMHAEMTRRYGFLDEMDTLIPSPERAIVLLRRVPVYDAGFYVRHAPAAEERILYGRARPRFTAMRQLEAAFPGRTIYFYDHDRAAGSGRLERLGRRREEP